MLLFIIWYKNKFKNISKDLYLLKIVAIQKDFFNSAKYSVSYTIPYRTNR